MNGVRQREHPAEVTARRVEASVERYFRMLEPNEVNASEVLCAALREIAAGDRIARRR